MATQNAIEELLTDIDDVQTIANVADTTWFENECQSFFGVLDLINTKLKVMRNKTTGEDS
jgi:hypothetical protein